MGDGRLRRETVEGFPLFVERRGPGRRRAALVWGDGRLRRETVEGFPLFGGRRGPSRRRAALVSGDGRLRRETVEGSLCSWSAEARAEGERRSYRRMGGYGGKPWKVSLCSS